MIKKGKKFKVLEELKCLHWFYGVTRTRIRKVWTDEPIEDAPPDDSNIADDYETITHIGTQAECAPLHDYMVILLYVSLHGATVLVCHANLLGAQGLLSRHLPWHAILAIGPLWNRVSHDATACFCCTRLGGATVLALLSVFLMEFIKECLIYFINVASVFKLMY